MIFGRYTSTTGRITDIRSGESIYPDDVEVVAIPSGDGPWQYDPLTKIAGQVAKRTAPQVSSDLFALSPAQKNAVVLDLYGANNNTATTNAKIKTDVGPDHLHLTTAFAMATNAAGGAVFTGQIQQLILAIIYIIDNPRYLVHPAFDNTINISGEQVV